MKDLKKTCFISILVTIILASSVASAVHAIGVIGTITAVSSPSLTTYDAGKGEIFVVDGNHNTIDVISDSDNSLVASVLMGADPTALAYDSGKAKFSQLTQPTEVLALFQSYQTATIQ
jgi:hypothetical protein